MARVTQPLRSASRPAAPWPPDDTEESVMGTDFHQMTITNLRLGITEAAHTLAAPGQPLPWHALSQTTISGFTHPDGSPYTTLPDVFVYRQPLDPNRGSLAIGLDGPPVLLVEVLSLTTYGWDLNMEKGKGYSYGAAGVQEYLTIDPLGSYLPERVRAWRLVEGVYQPWRPDRQGRWQSEQVALAIALEGTLAAVYAGDERRMLREGEIEEERTGLRAALARTRENTHAALEQARAEREQARVEREQARAEIARQAEELERLRRLLEGRRHEID